MEILLHIRNILVFPTQYSKHETCKAYLLCLVSNKNADDQKKEDKEGGEDHVNNRGHRDWICRENRENYAKAPVNAGKHTRPTMKEQTKITRFTRP